MGRKRSWRESQRGQAYDDKGKGMWEGAEVERRDGLRRVKPYPYVFHASAKERWFGRPLLDVVVEEFGAFPREFFARQVRAGRLRVNGEQVGEDYVVRNGDRLSHAVIREETPVGAAPLRFVYRDRNLLVVDKPCGVPVHPCGSHYFNCLQGILATDHGLRRAHPAHRLDMPTSGVLLYGTSMTAAQHACAMIRSHRVKKVYLARVRGRFPRGPGDSAGLPRWQHRSADDAHATAARIRASRPAPGTPPPDEHTAAPMDVEAWWGPPPGEDKGALSAHALLDAARRTEGDALFEGVSLDDDEVGSGGSGAAGQGEAGDAVPPSSAAVAAAAGAATAGAASAEEPPSPLLPSPASVAQQLGARVLLSCPIGCISAARSVYACTPAGKDALTVVQALRYDARRHETLVACEPRTGRTHQLRVHLLQAGFPIVDDPVYGPTDVRGRYLRARVTYDAEGRRHMAVEGEPSPESEEEEAVLQRRLDDQRRLWPGISLHAWAYGTRQGGEAAANTAVDVAAAPIVAALDSLPDAAVPNAGKQAAETQARRQRLEENAANAERAGHAQVAAMLRTKAAAAGREEKRVARANDLEGGRWRFASVWPQWAREALCSEGSGP